MDRAIPLCGIGCVLNPVKMEYLYILYNPVIDRYYVGSTNNLNRRLLEHNSKKYSVRYTSKQKGLWSLEYKEEFETRAEAMKREKEIKRNKNRKYIEKLIMENRVRE